MATHSNSKPARLVPEPETESEAVLEEVIDASLHTDRAHHDELGRTEDPVEPHHHPEEAPPSPREQPAAPMTEADETAASVLREHRTTVEAVIKLLLEREVVEGGDVRRLLASEKRPAVLVKPATPHVDAA